MVLSIYKVYHVYRGDLIEKDGTYYFQNRYCCKSSFEYDCRREEVEHLSAFRGDHQGMAGGAPPGTAAKGRITDTKIESRRGNPRRLFNFCHRVNSFIFQRANPHILSPYPLHSLFRTLSLFSPIIIIALWNLTGRDFPRHFPLIFTSFPRPFLGYSHTLPTHFH